jgi:hypothetical protein
MNRASVTALPNQYKPDIGVSSSTAFGFCGCQPAIAQHQQAANGNAQKDEQQQPKHIHEPLLESNSS